MKIRKNHENSLQRWDLSRKMRLEIWCEIRTLSSENCATRAELCIGEVANRISVPMLYITFYGQRGHACKVHLKKACRYTSSAQGVFLYFLKTITNGRWPYIPHVRLIDLLIKKYKHRTSHDGIEFAQK